MNNDASLPPVQPHDGAALERVVGSWAGELVSLVGWVAGPPSLPSPRHAMPATSVSSALASHRTPTGRAPVATERGRGAAWRSDGVAVLSDSSGHHRPPPTALHNGHPRGPQQAEPSCPPSHRPTSSPLLAGPPAPRCGPDSRCYRRPHRPSPVCMSTVTLLIRAASRCQRCTHSTRVLHRRCRQC